MGTAAAACGCRLTLHLCQRLKCLCRPSEILLILSCVHFVIFLDDLKLLSGTMGRGNGSRSPDRAQQSLRRRISRFHDVAQQALLRVCNDFGTLCLVKSIKQRAGLTRYRSGVGVNSLRMFELAETPRQASTTSPVRCQAKLGQLDDFSLTLLVRLDRSLAFSQHGGGNAAPRGGLPGLGSRGPEAPWPTVSAQPKCSGLRAGTAGEVEAP